MGSPKYKRVVKKVDGPKLVCQNADCEKMGKYLKPTDFYKSRNEEIRHHPFCKDCVNKAINIKDMNTVYNTLKVLDTPFIMNLWMEALKTDTKNYIGEYLKLINAVHRYKYKNKRFEDSIYEYIEEPEPEEVLEEAPVEPEVEIVPEVPLEYLEDEEEEEEEEQKEPEEEKLWSAEWQGYYTEKDLKYLDDYYTGLQNDFKIVTTNHKDYARKIAQASLSQTKAFQRFQNGEEGADVLYEKSTRLFDMLSKSAQFAESQRSANDVALGCFGKVFDAVEKHNWVPEHVPVEDDVFDKLIKQFSNIERSIK